MVEFHMTENIYGLFDPEQPGKVMYVGKTKRDPKLRLQGHYQHARHRLNTGKHLLPITEWLLSLNGSGRRAGIRLLEVAEDGDAYLAEWEWIERLKSPLNTQGNTRTDAKWHGTSGGYTNHRCRCAECRKAWALTVKTSRLRRKDSIPAHSEGSENYYGNYGCRCAPCISNWTVATYARRDRRAELGDQSHMVGVSNRGSGKLTAKIIERIIELYKSGIDTEELAKRFGVTNAAISLALRGRIHG